MLRSLDPYTPEDKEQGKLEDLTERIAEITQLKAVENLVNKEEIK